MNIFFSLRKTGLFNLILILLLNVSCNIPEDNTSELLKGKFLSINGKKLWIETLGHGTPLFLIAGKNGYRSSDKTHYDLYEKFPLSLVHSYCPDNSFEFPDTCKSTFNHKVYYQIVGGDGDFTLGGDAVNYDVTNELKNLHMPTLIIAGRYDRMCKPELTLEYKKYCPQAKFIMFEYSGHNPQIDEKQLLLKTINAFLKN